MKQGFIHNSALIEETASIGKDVFIWAWTHVREEAIIEDEVVIAEHSYVGPGVRIGKKTKIQNGCSIYEPAELGEGVFIGPGVVLTNDKYPRAINAQDVKKSHEDWESVGVRIGKGASVGAGSICVAPLEIGEWAMVAAGSVVTRNVPAFALFAGNPATFVRWVGKSGKPLQKSDENTFSCPDTGEIYGLDSFGELKPQ